MNEGCWEKANRAAADGKLIGKAFVLKAPWPGLTSLGEHFSLSTALICAAACAILARKD